MASPHPLSRLARLVLALLCIALAATAVAAHDGTSLLGVGARLDSLTVGTTTYHHVQIRSVNPHSVMITHDAGMSSLRLRDLPPELQQQLGYDAAKDSAYEAAEAAKAAAVPARPKAKPTRQTDSRVDAIIRQFGEPALLQREVDLRPAFFQLDLAVKNQGRRPSCAIFAIVSALEFQYAQTVGTPEKFSEEYLSWATWKTVRRARPAGDDRANDPHINADADEGFSLLEVVAALRGYGIPLQSSMPNTFGRAIQTIADPPPDVVNEAREHERVFIHILPGRDNATRINNIFHALNAGMPVPVGLGWPHYHTLHGGYLSRQAPMAGRAHAVTLVGYRAQSDRVEDTLFIFKNSWGPEWGQGGYGTVTYEYLQKNLHSAVLLEVNQG